MLPFNHYYNRILLYNKTIGFIVMSSCQQTITEHENIQALLYLSDFCRKGLIGALMMYITSWPRVVRYIGPLYSAASWRNLHNEHDWKNRLSVRDSTI